MMTLHIYWREIVNIIIIISDDESRVVLEELPGQTGSDYINASWINVTIDISNKSTLYYFYDYAQGYKHQNAYIAAQGI